jgi:hypothetical protein
MRETLIVVCRDDPREDGARPYVLATRKTFPTRERAEDYRRTVSPSREPLVVELSTALLTVITERGITSC